MIIAVVLLGIAPPLFARGAGGVVVSHSEALQNLAIERHAAQVVPGAFAQAPATLVFDALGQRFELELQPNTRLVSAAFPDGLSPGIGVYRGRLAGKEGSWARIVIANGVPTGLVWDGTEMLAIEPIADALTQVPAAPSIYRLKDTYVEPGTMSCGTESRETSLAVAYATIADELQTAVAQAAGAVEELKIGMVADFEFTHIRPDNVEAEILARMNNVDGIFSEQLGVQITVEVIDTFGMVDDPFTSSAPDKLLEQVASYRVASPAQTSQGLTHLITGRDLDGTTVGIAYREGLCSDQFGAGLSEGTRGIVTDSLVAAHEIGHNFGAEHDGEAGSPCESVTGEFLMSPRVSGTDRFSSCSIDTMRPQIDRAACIQPLPVTDVAITIAGADPKLFLGTARDLIFDIVNRGIEDALNVEATFDIPPNLMLDSVATMAGSCMSGAGQASCTIGTVPGNGSASVALSVMPVSLGIDTLNASVSADDDVNPDNNSQSVPVVVELATDLRISNTAPVSIMVDDSLTLNPRIDNLSTLAATNLALSISLSGGLRVDSASWPGGTCTVDPGAVNCQLADLAAGASVSLDIHVTGTAAGSQTYMASIVSLEADANEADNNVTGTVTVTSPGGGTSDGGGGAFGFAWLLLLSGAAGALRRRQA